MAKSWRPSLAGVSDALNLLLLVALFFIMARSFSHEQPLTVTAMVGEETPIVSQSYTSREFSNLDELNEWLGENRVVFLAPDRDGVIGLVEHKAGDNEDCDDQAIYLQKKAFTDGYLMSVHLVYDGKILGVKVTDYMGSHMGNIVLMGNSIYYIEPEPDGQVTFIVNRD